MERFLGAAGFAVEAHAGQFRNVLDPDRVIPYATHPIRVCEILIRNGICERENADEILAAAVLHDVIEDTKFTAEDIAERFGDRVTELVVGLTHVPKPEQVERVRKGATDENLIRAADKLANVLDIKELFIDRGDVPEDYGAWIARYLAFAKELAEAIDTGDPVAAGIKKELIEVLMAVVV